MSDILETAALMSDPLNARSHVVQELENLRKTLKISSSNGRTSDGKRAGIQIFKDVLKDTKFSCCLKFLYQLYSLKPNSNLELTVLISSQSDKILQSDT